MKKGWKSISSVIDIDEPEPYGRYFGCEHEGENNVKLKPKDHPFAHVFSETSSVAVVSQHRTNDFYGNTISWTAHGQDTTSIPGKSFFTPGLREFRTNTYVHGCENYYQSLMNSRRKFKTVGRIRVKKI